MGLSGVKGGEPAGKEVKGWIVKHKTNVCSSPGVTREGLQAPAPPAAWAPAGTHEEAPVAAMAGQKHQEGRRGCSPVQRSLRAHRPRGHQEKGFERKSGFCIPRPLPRPTPEKATVLCLEFLTLPSAALSTEASRLSS